MNQTGAQVSTPAARQREVRVGAGLAELDIWLGDQVRTGLAQTDRSRKVFAAMAARMVDAQAPGVAAVLRRLPEIVAGHADWPELLLREYARLHLLIAAHRRLAELAPPLQASVRTHIGYPTRTASVREEPAVRDQWMVLGVRMTEEERLHTRRTWLYGRRTQRWALLVEHSFGTADFPKDVPALGMMAEADVHYYPGAAPLRALWGERYDGDEPFTTLPRASESANFAGTVSLALAAQARALAADPWLWAWPVLLTDVVPVVDENGWQITESSGAALPLTEGETPWQLLGISGGHPVTVIGEWTAAGLVPFSVFATGEVIDLEAERGPGVRGSAATAGSEHLTSVALLGTARRAVDTAQLGEQVGEVAGRLTTDPAMLLLESVALQDAFARGGALATSTDLPEPAPDDARRQLPAAAAQRLAKMLRERSVFLPEWFDAAAPHDFRAPDALCALLLEQASAHAGLRPLLLRLAGERGRWLAAQHPDWRKLEWPSESEGGAGDTPASWLSAKPAERLAWFTRLRHRDPDAAREMLTQAWPKESGAVKAELLATFSEALSVKDESLLEAALDDRRADVRRTASGLLALLPDSAFGQRMTARARAWLRIEPSTAPGAARFVIDLPNPLDTAARRDGMFDRPVEFTYRWNGTPDPTAGRLRQLVAATPLHHWQTLISATNTSSGVSNGPANSAAGDHPSSPPMPTTSPLTEGNPAVRRKGEGVVYSGSPDQEFCIPEEVIRVGVDERFRQPLFDGWVDATLAQHDSAWAKALFEAGVPSDVALLRRRELFALLPEDDRVRHLLRLDGAWISEIEALLPAMGHPWPEALAQHLILLLFERSRVAAQRAGAHGSGPAAHRSLLVAAAAHLPVSAAGMAAVVARRCEDPGWQQAFDRLARDLTHRSMMLEELQ
ncbi:DUF5691 domain-containing protein [Nocardia sp. XZ_19_385]|uniref:DUF5691 domain-containing protein n=1 Tax=Nocardia sp. XZ_19_385 TaxID=2769488 RepID=UPI001E482E2D|nr:DUF5691 domain-containing protein [Nocardia sp. XZ_19_385]